MSFFYGVRVGWRPFFINLLQTNKGFQKFTEEWLLDDEDFNEYTLEDCVNDLKCNYTGKVDNMSVEDLFIDLISELGNVEVLGAEGGNKINLDFAPNLTVQCDARDDGLDSDGFNYFRIGRKINAYNSDLQAQELPQDLTAVKDQLAVLFPTYAPEFLA